MTALVNTLSLWQLCQMARASIGLCRMTSGPARKKSPRPLEKPTLKAGTRCASATGPYPKGCGFFCFVRLTKTQNSNKDTKP